jgi:hypothetical protein
MIDDVQSETPKDDSIDFERRWFVKGLITGVAGLAFTTGVTSSALAKSNRRRGRGRRQPQPQPQTTGRRRRRGH